MSGKLCPFPGTLRAIVSNLQSTFPENYSEENFSLEKLRFFKQTFSDIKWKSFELLAKNFWHGCQNCILCVQSNKSRKTFYRLGMNKFSETPTMMEDIAALFWNFFRWALKNFMLFPEKHFEKKVFSKKTHVFWSSSDIGQKKYHYFGWTFSTWLSKLHLTCSEDHFENLC